MHHLVEDLSQVCFPEVEGNRLPQGRKGPKERRHFMGLHLIDCSGDMVASVSCVVLP